MNPIVSQKTSSFFATEQRFALVFFGSDKSSHNQDFRMRYEPQFVHQYFELRLHYVNKLWFIYSCHDLTGILCLFH